MAPIPAGFGRQDSASGLSAWEAGTSQPRSEWRERDHPAGRSGATSSHPSPPAGLRRAAGIDPDRLGGRRIGIHSLRKTAINDAIRNEATIHEVREFAGHADIRTTEVYFVRREEDAEVAARRIQIRLTGSRGQ